MIGLPLSMSRQLKRRGAGGMEGKVDMEDAVHGHSSCAFAGPPGTNAAVKAWPIHPTTQRPGMAIRQTRIPFSHCDVQFACLYPMGSCPSPREAGKQLGWFLARGSRTPRCG